MSVARARVMVVLTGIIVALVVGLSLARVGGPDAGRRDRRDATRLTDLRQIADALACHARGRAEPAQPATLAEISVSCLAPEQAARLVDPTTGDAYRIERPNADTARVCADFEDPRGFAGPGWPPFDAATGCVTVSLR